MGSQRRNLLLLLACSVTTAHAEGLISAGVRGGIPFRDLVDERAFSADYYDAYTTPFLVGPTFAVNFPKGLAAQVDVLFRRFRVRVTAANLHVDQTSYTGEIPVMLKWQNHHAAISPFVNGGVTFRTFGDIRRAAGATFAGDFETAETFTTGFVLGGGVRFKLGALKIAPEIRWSRFGTDNFSGRVNAVFTTVRNQADFLVGLYF